MRLDLVEGEQDSADSSVRSAAVPANEDAILEAVELPQLLGAPELVVVNELDDCPAHAEVVKHLCPALDDRYVRRNGSVNDLMAMAGANRGDSCCDGLVADVQVDSHASSFVWVMLEIG